MFASRRVWEFLGRSVDARRSASALTSPTPGQLSSRVMRCGAMRVCIHHVASDTARFAASVAENKYAESMHIPQEPLAEAANQTLWKLHATASAESDCDPLAASESGEVCCEREQSVVFRNLSDTQKAALCGDWHSTSAVTRVFAAASVLRSSHSGSHKRRIEALELSGPFQPCEAEWRTWKIVLEPLSVWDTTKVAVAWR